MARNGAVVGTPADLSVVQCKGESATPLSDVYALGCTYFQLLTSRLPFDAPNLPGLLYQHVNQPMPNPRRFADDVPDAVCRIVARATAKDPVARFPSAMAMLADLEAVLRGGSEAMATVVDETATPQRSVTASPAALAVAEPPNNLPAELTSFVGRAAELARADDLLCTGRLVTLVGPGGTGKIRLALRRARRALGDCPDGVWFAELAAVERHDAVARLLADVLGLRETAGHSASDQVIEHLRERRALIVLDNCEHVIGGAVAAEVLAKCPDVRVMTTSRQALRCEGESVHQVPSLAVATGDEGDGTWPPTVDDLERAESSKLFIDRARAVRPDFRVSASNAADIARVCIRLDGIPWRSNSPRPACASCPRRRSPSGSTTRPGSSPTARGRSAR